MSPLPLFIALLFPTAFCGVCPDGYVQGKGGGDCFQGKTFYESFMGVWYPQSFDDAENACNSDGGGLLTAIHSDQENAQVEGVKCDMYSSGYFNIGLRCKGRDCYWDDGSAVNYERFLNVPADDSVWRCYGIHPGFNNNSWIEQGCGSHEKDCWICRVKARTIDCVEGETEYKGGCVSIYSPPVDQKEPSCPGGRLVSIHSYQERQVYLLIALKAGVNGTVTIGGTFNNRVFQWTDGSITTYQPWAYGFPNAIFGTCVQMLLDSEFGSQGQFTNIDCDVHQPYICIRDGSEPDSTPQAKADARCPPIQYYSAMGNIYSPDFPLSIPGGQSCEYVIGTLEGSKASVKFTSFDCQSGTTLSFFDGMNSNQPFKTFTTDSPELNQYYTASSNVLKIVFSANGTAAGTGWEAEFAGI